MSPHLAKFISLIQEMAATNTIIDNDEQIITLMRSMARNFKTFFFSIKTQTNLTIENLMTFLLQEDTLKNFNRDPPTSLYANQSRKFLTSPPQIEIIPTEVELNSQTIEIKFRVFYVIVWVTRLMHVRRLNPTLLPSQARRQHHESRLLMAINANNLPMDNSYINRDTTNHMAYDRLLFHDYVPFFDISNY